MSLHHIAQHLKDQGRGPDDMLVHMSHGEVKALQSLAKAHGGSLTINPHTGLPEAGFLSSMLPVALGAAGMAMGIPTPMLVGGIALADYAITGSLKQGLMAGLGAWSGSSLASGLAETGTQGLVEAGGNAGATAFEQANKAALTAGTAEAGTEAALTQPQIQAQNAINSTNFPNVPQEQLNTFRSQALNAADQGKFLESVGRANASLGNNITNPTFSENFSNMASGVSNPAGTGAFDSLKNLGSFAMNNKSALLGAAAPALYGALNNKPTVPGSTAQKNPFGLKTIPRDENGNPIFNASLPTPPNPAYKPVYPNYQTNPYTPVGAAEGGVMKMAVGGSAPQIGTPAQNTTMDSSVGNNTMFPMSEMARSYYATPTQLPAGINAQNNPNPAGQSNAPQIPGYGPKLDTNTGQMINNFADGGLANLPYVQQSQNQPSTSNGYTPAGGGSTYGQGQYSPQTMVMPTMGLDPQSPFSQMGMPTQFAQGGIAQYAGDKYGSMIKGYEDMQSGLETATKRKMLDTPTPDVGIYTPDSETKGMDSLDAAMHYLNKNMAVLPKSNNTIKKTGSLGAISHTPAAQAAQETAAAQKAKESIAKESNPSEAKEGGVIGMAFGGRSSATQTAPTGQKLNPQIQGGIYGDLARTISPIMSQQPQNNSFVASQPSMQGHVYQPGYANYAQSPYQAQPMLNPAQLQAASQAYLNQGIPTPTRTMAAGGLSMGGHLGNYSDGGHLLKGPGDGVSDSIPATIGGKQPARLAEGEFVIPARIVSELGNGSTDAGAKRLYAMMDRIKAKRRKTKNIAADTKAYKYLPA